MSRTGHHSLEGIRTYKRISDEQQQAVSTVLNDATNGTPPAEKKMKSIEIAASQTNNTLCKTELPFQLAVDSNCTNVTINYSTGHRQRQNETRLNAFGGQIQMRLHSPRPSNAGNSRALKA